MGVITKKAIDDFYANKRVALIGASRKKSKYGGMLLKELKKRGYDVVPVNPNASEIEGIKCFANIGEVNPPVNVAFAVVPPSEQEKVAKEAAEAGIKTLWMHEHVMKGVSNPAAIGVLENRGVGCITGFCPMMFMPNTGLPHNIHKAIMGLFGALPK